MTNKPNGSKTNLDAPIAAALADANTPKAELETLLTEAREAIESANETIKTESERELDLANVDPDKSADLVRKAQRTIARLQKAVPLLAERIQDIVKAEYAEEWHERADTLESDRDALAKELSALYVPFVGKIANLFAKIDALDARISELNATAPYNEHRRLLGTELVARKLDSFTGLNPPLRENLKLPDPSCTRDICFPPPFPLDQLYAAMAGASAALARKHEAACSDGWYEAQKLEEQQKREEIEKREAELDEQRAQSERAYHDALRKEDEARRWPVNPPEKEPVK